MAYCDMITGEGQVYTVGMIGKHRIVATKLARIGMKTDAMIAAGNTITRLLGKRLRNCYVTHRFYS